MDTSGAAGNSSPAQMMDVVGSCKGGGQMLVALQGLALVLGFSWKALKVFHANQERGQRHHAHTKVLNVTDLWVAALGFLPEVGSNRRRLSWHLKDGVEQWDPSASEPWTGTL